jgi:hypothetical protein
MPSAKLDEAHADLEKRYKEGDEKAYEEAQRLSDERAMQQGMPIVTLWRGFRRENDPSQLETSRGRATTSFTPVKEVANLYSHALSTITQEEGSSVKKFYLDLKNPLDLRDEGTKVSLGDIIENHTHWDLSGAKEPSGMDALDIVDILDELEGQLKRAYFEYDIDHSNDSFFKMQDFDDLKEYISERANRIEEAAKKGEEDENAAMEILFALNDTTLDAYAIADNNELINWLKDNDYDGIIHKDTIEAGARHFKKPSVAGRPIKEVEGIDVENDYSHDTYRPFDQEQIKLADPFTYDDQGNLIPLSQRFNQQSNDIRFMPYSPELPKTEDGKVDWAGFKTRTQETAKPLAGLSFMVSKKEDKSPMPMSALNVLHSDSDVLPKPEKKVANAKVAVQLADIATQHHGRVITSNDITPQEEQAFIKNGADEAEAALKSSGKNAGNWYSTAMKAAVAVAGVLHKVISDPKEAMKNPHFAKEPNPTKAAQFAFLIPLAITSQNQTVPLNTRYGEEQFNHFQKTGKFDPSKKYGEKAASISGNLELANHMIDVMGGLTKLEDFIKQEFTVKELEDAASKIAGKKITIAGRKTDMVNGAAIFGPKIGQGFLQNLMGKFDPVTIDLWMRRTWGRWTGDVVGDGVTGVRLGRLIQEYRNAGRKLPDSLKTLRTVMRSTGTTSTGKPTKPEMTISENVQDRIENDPDFRKNIEELSKEANAEFQGYYKLMGSPVSDAMMAEVSNVAPIGKKKYSEETREQRDAAYNKLIKEQQKIKFSLENKWDELSPAQKKALNTEDPTKAITKAKWIDQQHKKAGRTKVLSNEQKNAIKPQWAAAAKSIVADLNPIDIPTDQDRVVISRVVNGIRKELEGRGYNVTNADVQAILWYPEKDLWAKLRGEEESNLKQSYDDELLKIAEQRGLGAEARAIAKRIRGY